MMSYRHAPSVPDVADRHRRLVAWALLLIGGRFVASAALRVVGPAVAEVLGWAELGFSLASVGCIIPIFVWKARNRSSPDWSLYKDQDGFVAKNVVRAQGVSWASLFLTLIALDLVVGRFGWLTSGLVVEAVLATMVVSFSVTFLLLDRDPGDA